MKTNFIKIIVQAIALTGAFSTVKAQNKPMLYIADTPFTTGQTDLVFVNGDVTYDGSSKQTINHNGLLEIKGSWYNNALADLKVFTDQSSGFVLLNGGRQTFNGSNTRFPNLTIAGTDKKIQNTSVEIKDKLNLTDRELDVNGNTATVLSTATDAINYSQGGYVNTTVNKDGWLVRNQSSGSYAYPLGNNGSRFRVRPLMIAAEQNGLIYGQFQNYNPDNDGFSHTLAGPDVKGVYDQYYHRVKSANNNTLAIQDYYELQDGDFSTLVQWDESKSVWNNLKSLGPIGSLDFKQTDTKFTASELAVIANAPIPITFATKAKFFIPNVFTPNGDNINDVFHIEGLENYEQCEMVIINRWGNEVYKDNNYGKEGHEWNGSDLNEGVYFYVLKVKTKGADWEKYTGYVHLIRK